MLYGDKSYSYNVDVKAFIIKNLKVYGKLNSTLKLAITSDLIRSETING